MVLENTWTLSDVELAPRVSAEPWIFFVESLELPK